MSATTGCLAGALLLALSSGALGAAVPAQHDDAYWRALKLAQFKLTDPQSAPALAAEAARKLGSPDPETRDGIAYEALADWIYRDQLLSPAELEALRVQLQHNAGGGLGARGDDSLFLRSFSLLVLSVLAAEDLQRPYLSQEQYAQLVDLGVRSLTHERDLRGYIPGKGWGHATAHAADLLKYLARNARLQPAQQRQIVEAVATRLRTAGQVFAWGEDARLAAALAAVTRRPDADAANFARWFEQMRTAHRRLWDGTFDPAQYVVERAQLNTLAQLSFNLDSDPAAVGSPAIRELLAAAARDLR